MIPTTRWACLAAAAYLLVAAPSMLFERTLVREAPGGMLLRAQAVGELGRGARRRITNGGDAVDAEYGFHNFNNDELSVSVSLPKAAIKAAQSEFGYTQKDLDKLKAWREQAAQEAYRQVTASGAGQAAYDAKVAAIDKQYKAKLRQYLSSRGFKLMPGNYVTADMPTLVERGRPGLKPLAQALAREAVARGYDGEMLVAAASAMVQTAVGYEIPPPAEGARRIGGVFHPVEAVARGWGDCDTKTGILASVLTNWPDLKMVGVGLPEHYLAGIIRIPNRGEVYVEYGGMQFVLIEPAGPAWLPVGQVGQQTQRLLEATGVEIEPFFSS